MCTPSPTDDEEIKKNHLDQGVRGGMEEALTHLARRRDSRLAVQRAPRRAQYGASDTRIGAACRTRDIRHRTAQTTREDEVASCFARASI
jgi:hypothetical protein